MKNKLFFTAIIFYEIFAFTGCGNLTGNVFGVNELVNKVTNDKDAWIGKEVTVSGYASHSSGVDDEKNFRLNIVEDKHDESERYVDCIIPPGDLTEAITSKTIEVNGKNVEVKGKIASVYTQNYLNMKRVRLESCELKK